MQFQEHVVPITEIIQETPEVKLFRVAYPDGVDLDFKPGQFFMISIPDDPEVKVARAYSVASSPANKESIEFGLNKVGIFSSRLFELKPGDKLKIKGPYGKFFFDEDDTRDVLLIGAGTGITPLMSILRCCGDKRLPHNLKLLYSVKTPDDIVYHKELEERRQQNPKLEYVVTCTRLREGMDWQGRAGRIERDLVKDTVQDPKRTVAFLCGGKEFVTSMIASLEELGFEKDQIKTDIWGH